MVKTRRSAVVTPDGFLELPRNAMVGFNHEFGAPELRGAMVIEEMWHNADIALARELHRQGVLQLFGKSGACRAGLHLFQLKNEEPEFDECGGRIVIPVGIGSFRAVQVRQNGVQDDLLGVMIEMSGERRVPVGRVGLMDEKDALSHDNVIDAVRQHQLAIDLNRNIEECVDENGCLSLPLEDLHFAFCESNFRTEQKRNVVRYGKHAMHGIQEERRGLTSQIDGKEFFVGGIRISIGPYIAVIDEETNTPGVIHLAARVLDGIRTTGLGHVRQVELFNKFYEAVSTPDLRIKIRFYHANKDVQKVAARVINERTIRTGVSFSDIVELVEHPERVMNLMRLVSPTVADGNPAGYFVGPGKAHKQKWVDNPSTGFHNANLEETTPKFSAGDPSYSVHGAEMPQPAEELARLLGYVGQEQTHSRLYVQWGFPDSDTMRAMLKAGVGVFAAHDLRQSHQTYSAGAPILSRKRTITVPVAGGKNVVRPPINDVFFGDQLFGSMKKLHREGARFLLVRHEAPDPFGEQLIVPEEVLKWDKRGLWIRPSSQERLEQVDTLIAMYGSHVKGMDPILRPQITRFTLRMAKLFGPKVGLIHGKGPGVMYMADYVARHLPELAAQHDEFKDITTPMTSWGVGIDLEQMDQQMNFHPDAQIDFNAQNRLVRQKHMNDRAVFNIFNLGGAGTLEEIALSLCSQKLYKNILAPLILVDPQHVGNEGQNFWDKLKVFIDDMCTKKVIQIPGPDGQPMDQPLDSPTVNAAHELNIHLLQGHMKNTVHIVSSYDEAADIIEEFVHDPVAYYTRAGVTKKEFEWAFQGAVNIREDTKFPMPSWMNGPEYLKMSEDPRWDTVQPPAAFTPPVPPAGNGETGTSRRLRRKQPRVE